MKEPKDSNQQPPSPVSQGWPGRTIRRYRDPEAYKAHLLSLTEARGDCMLFTGYISTGGYGMVTHKGKCQLAHYVLWEFEHGARPKGMQLDHACHDPEICKLGKHCPHRRCINIAHLRLVTPKRNTSRERSNAADSLPKALRSANLLRLSATHCQQGHEWSATNTRIAYKDGVRQQRVCRACHNIANAKYKKGLRAKIAQRR